MNSKTRIKDADANARRRTIAISRKGRVAAIATSLVASVGVLIYTALADAPVLTIAPLGSNQFLITITNGVTNANYEIYRTPVLGDAVNYPFTLHIIGTVGQTNFTIDMGTEQTGFVLGAIGSDFDNDGIENYRDGNPNDPNIGALSLTIDSPLNGTTLN